MNRPGGTVLARPASRWAAVVILIATGASAAGPDPSHATPANTGPNRTTATATGSAAATPPAPTGQVGLYENESIRRTSVAGAPASGGAGAAATPTATPWSLSRVPAALAVVVVLIVGLRWLMGKMTGASARKGSTRAMRVLARSTVSPRQQLMLIQIGKRLVLVGNSGGTMSPLCQIDDPTEVASLVGQIRAEQSSTPVSSFKSLFGRANNDYEPVSPGMFKQRPRDDEERDGELAERSAVAAEVLDRRETRDELTLSGAAVPAGGGAGEEEIANADADASVVAATSEELGELMAKVRRMSQGFPR